MYAPTGSLGDVLDALQTDHDWLFEGDVFTPDVFETWLAYKRERELARVNLRPVPFECFLVLISSAFLDQL